MDECRRFDNFPACLLYTAAMLPSTEQSWNAPANAWNVLCACLHTLMKLSILFCNIGCLKNMHPRAMSHRAHGWSNSPYLALHGYDRGEIHDIRSGSHDWLVVMKRPHDDLFPPLFGRDFLH